MTTQPNPYQPPGEGEARRMDALLATLDAPDTLKSLAQQELVPSERLLWADQPLANRYARQGIPLMIFGVFFTGFSLFWTISASGLLFGQPKLINIFFVIWGFPFLAVGCGMLASPWLLKAYARRTVYLVTDQRAIIVVLGWRNAVTVESFRTETLGQLERIQHADGTGDLIFRTDYVDGSRGRQRTRRIGFHAVNDVKRINTLLDDLYKNHDRLQK